MTTIYSAGWVIPVSSPPFADGAVAIQGKMVVGVGPRAELFEKFPLATKETWPEAILLPGLINAHTHLELTAMRGYLENEESDFFSWLKKLTLARLFKLSADDLEVSAMWGACEAAKAGITCVGDASDSALTSMRALKHLGLRGIVFQESFGPDVRQVGENVEKLKAKVVELRSVESELVRAGVSPHAPYTVCGPQLEAIAEFALNDRLPLMMHAGESEAEDLLLREGCGLFADNLSSRGISWNSPGCSPIEYLRQSRILECEPLLAHCIRVDEKDLDILHASRSKVAHCPKSNAKLGHGRAPFASFLAKGITVGFGSDSVASNNTCDIIEEARFATLMSRADEAKLKRKGMVSASQALTVATMGGARCLSLSDQVGELRAGLEADLAIISLKDTHQLPVYDPIASTIFSSSGHDVVLTVVGGREVYRDGRLIGVDEERLRARMGEIKSQLMS
jgi:cytosine/adenosine deaminase-related metal-dependent hydrolase